MNPAKTEHIETNKPTPTKKGGRIPVLRFNEFDGKWGESTLGELLTFKNGLNSDKDKYGSGLKFINVLDIIENDFITYDKIIGAVEVTEKEFEKNEVVYGDILFQRSSETREDVGQANVYLDKEKSAVFGGFVIRGHAKKEYEPMFMNFLLKTWLARKEITTKSGGSTRYNVGQDTLSQVIIFTTTLPEQQKIAAFLSAVNNKIQQLTRKKALLEQYKKGVMQKIFSRTLRFKDDAGNEYPDWVDMLFSDLYSFHSTNSLSRDKLNYEIGSVFNIHYGDIHTKYNAAFNIKKEFVPLVNINVDLSNVKAESYCKRGDLIMADASEDYADIGKTIELIDLNDEKVLAGLHTFLARPKTSKTSIGFFSFLLKSWNIRKQIMVIAQGTKVLSLSTGRVGKLKLQLPALEEQQKIATYLSAIDTKIEAVNNQITQTQLFKRGLLQKMFV